MLRQPSLGAGGGRVFCDDGVQELDALAVDLGPGARERREAADLAVDLMRGLGPVDAGFGFVDLMGVGDASLGLRLWCEVRELVKRLRDEARAEVH